MNNLTLFESKTPFNKLWLLLDLRAELDLSLTKYLSCSLSFSLFVFVLFCFFFYLSLKSFLYLYHFFFLSVFMFSFATSWPPLSIHGKILRNLLLHFLFILQSISHKICTAKKSSLPGHTG